MHLPLVAVVVVSGCQIMAQPKKEWEVERICGRVEHVQRIRDRKFSDTFSERRQGLRDLMLSLFERRDGEPCCDALVALETARTGRGGRFEFKAKKPGNFWLTTNWNAKEYKVAVVNKQQRDSSATCSKQGIGLDDSGNADWWVTITLD
jgi:hypothetical protein